MMNLVQFFLSHRIQTWELILEHSFLVIVATGAAVLFGIPVGILLTRKPALSKPVLAVANIVQTIPSLALFGFLIPLLGKYGIGQLPAIIALFLYSLLPIVRNTFTGINGIDPAVREAGKGMGMTDWQLLTQVELPLSLVVILAGVRVATVISVGTATIAAAIGAGGLGVFIFRGLRMNDNILILAGAVPAALMALAADFFLGLVEGILSPGSREKPQALKPRRLPSLLKKRIAAVILIAILPALFFLFWRMAGQNTNRSQIVIGSKDFTEQLILGELLAEVIESHTGINVKRAFELGGDLCHRALLAGNIDGYVEYTGTAYTAILKHKPISNVAQVYESVKREYDSRFHVEWLAPLGFNNTFAILVREKTAQELGLKKISDIKPYASKWRAAFGQDFISRKDGYQGFVETYGLKFKELPLEMDLSLTYRALADGKIDLIAGNSTDALIEGLHLYQLEDDRHYFPPYQAAPVFREAVLARYPAVKNAVQSLEGKISDEEMRHLNYEVDAEHKNVREVVKAFLRDSK